MTPQKTHLSEEELVLHFYGESDTDAVESHLSTCSGCRNELERLRQVLSLMDGVDAFAPAETPGTGFEREVWARLEPQLAPPQPWWSEWVKPRRLVLAASVATLLLVAFLAGRFSREDAAPATLSTEADSGAAERVLVVAVVDHLDRSQMVLLEVLNADVESAGDLAVEQTLARELVAANRLYRQSAVHTGDGSTGNVLEELERTLLEIANTPGNASKEDLDALRARIASRGLLFKVRVVHSEMRERERQTLLPGSQS